MPKANENATFRWTVMQLSPATLVIAWTCLVGAASASAQVADATQGPSTARLLTVEEGRSIVNAAWEERQPADEAADCSHLVHKIYLDAGFEYPYASSFELYSGNDDFVRVRFPHSGDLIVWPGHVGIVVDPLQHSFYSLVRTGLEEQDYTAPYWFSRGKPRFYRYRVQNEVRRAAKTKALPQTRNDDKEDSVRATNEERPSRENGASNRAPTAAVERTTLIYGPPAPAAGALAFAIPSSIVIAARNRTPTRKEVAEGISELSNAMGSSLRSDDPFTVPLPVVIVEKFNVERVEIKNDHGWARLQIDSKVSIEGGTPELKHRRESVRWELQRVDSAWKALVPADRIYVPHDVAVKCLATQLAQLAQSEGAAAHQEKVLQQESRLASLLSALLESK